jgi:hypothetical protein
MVDKYRNSQKLKRFQRTKQRKKGERKMKEEICTNCENIIGRSEQAYVSDGNIVCQECDEELRGSEEPQSAIWPQSHRESSEPGLACELSGNPTDGDVCEILSLDSHDSVVSPGTTATADYGSNESQVETKYRSVGGWLLLFCLILTVFSPLGNMIIYVATFDKVTCYFEQFPGLKTPFIIETTLTIGLMAFSVFAGICLWQIRPNAVSIAKAYLAVFLGVAILEIFLPLTGGLPPEVWGPVVKEGFRQAAGQYMFYWIWSSYLNKSKRVAATYSHIAQPRELLGC